MNSSRLLAVIAACALAAPALAQSAMRHLSGEFRLSSTLNLTHASNIPFSAVLTSRTGVECLFAGTFAVQVGSKNAGRRVEVIPGTAFIRCPGAAPARVAGHLAPAAWTPPQEVRCISRTKSGCSAYSASVAAGTPGMWLTWHAQSRQQAVQPEGARRD